MNTIETLKEYLKLAHESLDSKDAKIAELEKERDQILNSAINSEGNYLDLKKSMFAHNLEHQAKVISDFVSSIEGFSEGYIQALKEQDND
jgi:acetolactate synthase small subunit